VSIVVVGAGAIGLLVAGRLAQSGVNTTLVARQSTASAIAEHGLRIVQTGQRKIAPALNVVLDPSQIDRSQGEPSLAVLCVKGYDTQNALDTLNAINAQYILTLQNGIGNEEILVERFGKQRVISGIITTSVEVDGPGRITVTKEGGIGLAALDAKQPLEQIAKYFEQADFPTKTYEDYRSLKWSKALLNMVGNATSAILDMSVADIYQNPQLFALEKRANLEALSVMQHEQIKPLNLPRYPAALLAFLMRRVPTGIAKLILHKQVAGGRGGKMPSLHIDVSKGNKRTETDFLYGAVAQAAEQLGLAAPVNRTLTDILKGIINGEIPWDEYRNKPQNLLDAVRAAEQTSTHSKR
jgi:2-dehydropantoate 2-reductase